MKRDRIVIVGRPAHEMVPVDDYMKYLAETFKDVADPNFEERRFELEREPYADEYAGGRQHTCVHCNTSFRSMRREPKCPFCHKRPT